MTQHSGKSVLPRYTCSSARVSFGEHDCQSLAARSVDDEVVRLALRALAPSALEVSLQVAADWEKEREKVEAQWQYRLQRADYEVDRARRQYDAVEPENRLVCRTLESAWEQKMHAARELREEHERFLQGQPKLLTTNEREAIRRLADDLPALWQAATTTDVDRKAILRQILDKVVIQIEGKSEWVEAWLHWAAGHQTYTRFHRPVARLTQLSDWPLIRERMLALKREGRTAQEIAGQLNREKRISSHLKPFTATTIRAALSRFGLTDVCRRVSNDKFTLKEGEWFIPDLARELGVHRYAITAWIHKGKLSARQVDGRQGRWIVQADVATLQKLKVAATEVGAKGHTSA